MAAVNLCWSALSDVWFTSEGIYSLSSGDNATFTAAVCVRNARITKKAAAASFDCESAGAAGQTALDRWVRSNVSSSDCRHNWAIYGDAS